MAVQFTCPKCSQKVTLTASQPGDWLDCPHCEATVQVPGAAPPKPTAPRPVRKPPRARVEEEPEPVAGVGNGLKLALLAGAAMVLLAGAVAAVVVLQRPKKEPEPVRNEPPPANSPAGSPPVAPPKGTPSGKPKEPPKIEPAKPELADVVLTQTKQRTLRLGVSDKKFDDVGAILNSLGKGYGFTTLSSFDLENPARLKEFDVVFLNCGTPINRADRVQTALREFVAAGKTLYASDLQYPLVAGAFPEVADEANRIEGVEGAFEAEVLDAGLRELLGEKVELTFNLKGWVSAAFAGESVVTILRGGNNGRLPKGTPLLVKFGHQQGTVFFTSFHNSAIASETAKKILRYLVFSAVVADAEGRVLKVLKRTDYTLKPPELLAAPDTSWSVTRKHVLSADGLFRIGVAFNNEGAEVKLVVEGPGGVRLEKTGKDAFIAEVRYAPAGEWKLTISTPTLPYPNFPISLILAEPK